MMLDISIRPAKESDAAGLARVHVDTWKSVYKGIMPDTLLNTLNYEEREKKWREKFIQKANLSFVAEVNNEVVGFACVGPIRKPTSKFDSELYGIYVVPEHQGMGIGELLFQKAQESLKKAGYSSMMLWVLEKNPCREFYGYMKGLLLSETKTEEFGGLPLLEVAYGWKL